MKSAEVGVSFWDIVGPERETDGDVVHGIRLEVEERVVVGMEISIEGAMAISLKE